MHPCKKEKSEIVLRGGGDGRGQGRTQPPTSNSAACKIILQKLVKTVSDQQKRRELVASKSALQEILKVLQREGKG